MGQNPVRLLLPSQQANLITLLTTYVLSALAVGCASAPPPPAPPDESALSAAGFKVVVAKTPQQQEHLRNLKIGRASCRERGKSEGEGGRGVGRDEMYGIVRI